MAAARAAAATGKPGSQGSLETRQHANELGPQNACYLLGPITVESAYGNRRRAAEPAGEHSRDRWLFLETALRLGTVAAPDSHVTVKLVGRRVMDAVLPHGPTMAVPVAPLRLRFAVVYRYTYSRYSRVRTDATHKS
jgi:hypothetical protein